MKIRIAWHSVAIYRLDCREQQYSLGYTFTGLFLGRLAAAMESGGDLTLLELYTEVEEQYWLDHSLEKEMNEMNAREGRPSQVWQWCNRKLKFFLQAFAELVHAYGSRVQNARVGDLFSNSGCSGREGSGGDSRHLGWGGPLVRPPYWHYAVWPLGFERDALRHQVRFIIPGITTCSSSTGTRY